MFGCDDGVERARHLRPDPVEAILNERHDLGAALVPFRKLVFRVLRQRLHPFGDRPSRVADPLQDFVHLRVQALQLAPAHLVDLVRRHVGGRRGLERPLVILLAVRSRPHPGIVGRRRALGLQLSDLPLERRCNLLHRDHPRARCPVPGNVFRPPHDGLDERPAFAGTFCRQAHLPQRLVDQKGRRHQACLARRPHPAKLAVELLPVRLQACQVGLGIIGVLDPMVAIEETRHVEIGADILDDDIGRVAPASHGAHRRTEARIPGAPSHTRFERPRRWCACRARARTRPARLPARRRF